MTRGITRRRALRIVGAGAAVPLAALGLGGLKRAPEPVRWRGEVLGGLSAMTLWHPTPRVAERAVHRMLVEVDRLENLFSLYRRHSEIARLNRHGRLDRPSRDLLHVFEESRRIALLSNGAFDPTIQPLWQLHASGQAADPARRDRARALVDYRAVTWDTRAIGFGRAGKSASLNGIAQGFITDRITDLLANEGFENAVIELGETRALGAAPDGGPFPMALVMPGSPHRLGEDVPLADAALSVSGGYGTRFGAAGDHHIFDPRTGRSSAALAQVAVVSPRAVWADALSTAICVAGEDSASRLLSAYPGSRAFMTRADGSTRRL